MKSVIEAAIKILLGEVSNDMKSDDALKLTQAALNLAHTAQVLEQVGKKP